METAIVGVGVEVLVISPKGRKKKKGGLKITKKGRKKKKKEELEGF